MLRQTAAAISVALAMAACDNNPHPAPLREKDDDGSPWVVRYQAMRTDPRSFDPQYTYDQMSRKAIEAVYDTLLEYHPLKTDPYELIPCMLAEMPVREEGGLAYSFRMKEGIHFHDDPCFPDGKGREVVAEDVQFVFQRIADPEVLSPFLSVFEESIAGIAEANAAAKENGGKFDYQKHRVSGIEVLDRYRFRLRMKKDYPQILYWLAFQCTAPTAREAVAYYDGREHDGVRREDFRKFASVGTGPFRIVQYTPRSHVRLERVKGYKTSVFPSDGAPPEKAEWLKQFAGKSLPFIDEIQMSVIGENIPRFVLFRQGYLDGISVDKDAYNAMVSPMRTVSAEYAARDTVLEPDFELSTFWLAFNMDDPVVGKNKKLRQAIAHSFDSARYSEIFYSGVAPVATQLLPPGIFGYEKGRPARYPFDLEKSRRLLAEAGYPGGRDPSGKQLEITLASPTDSSEYRQRAEFLQMAVEKLGIKVPVNGVTFARMQDIEDRGDFQFVEAGWGADYPDPENYFMLLYSKNIPPVGKNYYRYRNPEFDDIFERMTVTPNGPERLALIRKLNEIVDEDIPLATTFNKAFYGAVQPWAKRTHNNLMLETEGGVKYLQTDVAERARRQREWNRPVLWPAYGLGVLAIAAIAAFIRALRRTRNQVA
jgi:oligopeptide transport system substrate-binding protein